MSRPLGLSRQRLKELRLVWAAFQSNNASTNKLLHYDQFVLLLQSIGIVFTREDLHTLKQEYDMRGPFSFEDLVHSAAGTYNEEAVQERLITGLREIADSQGNLKIEDLRTALYKVGLKIKLSMAEIDAFLSLVPRNTGKGDTVALDDLILRLLAD